MFQVTLAHIRLNRNISSFLQNQLIERVLSQITRQTHTLNTTYLSSTKRNGHCHMTQCRYYNINEIIEPSAPIYGRYPTTVETSEEAFCDLNNDAKIFIHGGAATPVKLVHSLCTVAKDRGLSGLKTWHIHLEGEVPFTDPAMKDIIRSSSLFTGQNCRDAIRDGNADFTPIFLSEIPLLFRRKIIELDYALISVSPPDRHGYCSFGVSVDVTRSAVQNARIIVALVNSKMPVTRGDASIHLSQIDYMFNSSSQLPQLSDKNISDVEMTIGKFIAHDLIEDGATLQTGIGAIPSAVLSQLNGHKNLGVHTEMFSDQLVDLVSLGAVTNAMKKIRPGLIVSSFVIGSDKVFNFVDDNPFVDMRDVAWTNSTHRIAQNPKVAAINSCIEVDLTGQVVSDSIGQRIYSGVGGQVDFIRGASLCTDGRGKPIIALCSTTRRGESKIVPTIKNGSGVVTTRANVHYIVTEFGIAQLFGRNLRQRAYALIKIAHPDHRAGLEKAAFERLKCMPSPD